MSIPPAAIVHWLCAMAAGGFPAGRSPEGEGWRNRRHGTLRKSRRGIHSEPISDGMNSAGMEGVATHPALKCGANRCSSCRINEQFPPAPCTVTLRGLKLWIRIGVPDEERRAEQRILVTVTMEYATSAGTTDRLEDTVDYEEVERAIREVAKGGCRTLEKLAEDIATAVLMRENIRRVTIEIRKFSLPGTEAVTLAISRP